MTIKVFQLNDCDWYAGLSMEDCLAAYIFDTGISREEATDEDAKELTDADMERLQFTDGEPGDKNPEKRSFKAQLALMVEDGSKFPCFFASTEY